jgi:hypothetical protein
MDADLTSESTHEARHPRLDEASKDGLWRHLNGSDHRPGKMPGFVSHYTKPVLVEIHRALHARKADDGR